MQYNKSKFTEKAHVLGFIFHSLYVTFPLNNFKWNIFQHVAEIKDLFFMAAASHHIK